MEQTFVLLISIFKSWMCKITAQIKSIPFQVIPLSVIYTINCILNAIRNFDEENQIRPLKIQLKCAFICSKIIQSFLKKVHSSL